MFVSRLAFFFSIHIFLLKNYIPIYLLLKNVYKLLFLFELNKIVHIVVIANSNGK